MKFNVLFFLIFVIALTRATQNEATDNAESTNNHQNLEAECLPTSYTPNPDSGCCGLEATDIGRITESHNPLTINDPTNFPNNWMSEIDDYLPESLLPWLRYIYGPILDRRRRAAAENAVNVTIGSRITGGKETEFEQYPWTVLLLATFDFGDHEELGNCGGSLISSKYVLTAAHCLQIANATVSNIKIYLSEYDKRTFPKDCKNVLGVGSKCIENLVMNSEDMILHPQYNRDLLQNDIALIRLRGTAPYTKYIRPICLLPFNLDSPEFTNLPLAVAGWGRNGPYTSDVKQSTVVNLVPQEQCKMAYPVLSTHHICAAGYTGEDTCQGDSGGPLMTVYGGKYYVVGVVSGKRADLACGESVPSLYTNVYNYLDWISDNIKN